MASQRLRTIALLVIWLGTAIVYAQNTLQIQYPHAPPAPQIKDLYPKQYLKFAWSSTWPNTSLWIFQERSDGGGVTHDQLESKLDEHVPRSRWNAYSYEESTAAVGPQVTEHAWSAHKLRKIMSRGDPFWLYLFNANDQSCQACTSKSTRFYIRDRPNDNALKIGLGVGLGVGIPIIVAICCVAIWLRMRRRNNQKHGSRTILLRDTSKGIGLSPLPTSTAQRTIYTGSIEKNSPHESGGRDVVELPPSSLDVPVEAPVARERVELEGDYTIDRDVKDEVLQHDSKD